LVFFTRDSETSIVEVGREEEALVRHEGDAPSHQDARFVLPIGLGVAVVAEARVSARAEGHFDFLGRRAGVRVLGVIAKVPMLAVPRSTGHSVTAPSYWRTSASSE
jgi:hypothetical protein